MRFVPVPAERRAGGVLGNQDLPNSSGWLAGEGSDPISQRKHLSRKRRGRFRTLAGVIVAKPDRGDSPKPQITVKLERLQRQCRNPCDQFLFFGDADELVCIAKSARILQK